MILLSQIEVYRLKRGNSCNQLAEKKLAIMQLIGVLVLSCMCLQAISSCAGDAKGPSKLADQLSAGICATNHSRVQEFYKSLRDAENRDVQFPDSSKQVKRAKVALVYDLHAS